MWHAMFRTIGVEKMRRAWEQPLPETSFFIVQPGVDDLAVTRRGVLAHARFGFQQQDLAPRDRQRARYREADDTRTDHDTVCRLHERSSLCALWRHLHSVLCHRTFEPKYRAAEKNHQRNHSWLTTRTDSRRC